LIYQNAILCPALAYADCWFFGNDISKRRDLALEYATVLDNNSPLHPSRPPSAQERLACAGIVLPAARPPIANFVGGVQQGDLLFCSDKIL
jgi:hypothetical protein